MSYPFSYASYKDEIVLTDETDLSGDIHKLLDLEYKTNQLQLARNQINTQLDKYQKEMVVTCEKFKALLPKDESEITFLKGEKIYTLRRIMNRYQLIERVFVSV